jgi:hypothetical protein
VIILFLSITSYALPDVEEFKAMCADKEQEMFHFNTLNLMLAKSNLEDKRYWIYNFNDDYNSPLVYSIYVDSLLIAKLIIEQAIKMDINYKNFTMKNGTSMLTLAAKKNNFDSVFFLVNYTYPIKMDSGLKFSSPLHEAAKHQNTMIFFTLNKKCSDITLIHRKDNENLTPINYLINQQKEFLVINLLNSFPVNLSNIPKDSKNMTYLHHAVNNKLYNLTQTLLQQGLDAKQTSDLGSAFYIAKQKKYSIFLNLMEHYNFIYQEKKHTKDISYLTTIFACCWRDKNTYEPIL